jgi:outer membrane protein assembly factor BamB
LRLGIVLSLAACNREERPPHPSFADIFPVVTGDMMTSSSPNLADLDADGVRDIVFGTGVDRTRPVGRRLQFMGEPAISGEVVAVSGATNRILWKVPNPRDAFTTPRFAQLNRDRIPDVIMGGREGVLTAYDGTNGRVIWRLLGDDVVETPFPYYFLTPALIADVDADGIQDLIDTYGGNDTRSSGEARDSAYLMLISGATGTVLRTHVVPDRAESYSSPVVYRRRDGSEWVVFGTGGETFPGAAYRAPVASLLTGDFPARVEALVPRGRKGTIAPATILEIDGDGEPEIAISTFDGRLVIIDGATRQARWTQQSANEETYHAPAVVRMSNGDLGLLLSRGIGAFPRYVGTVHRLLDARDGHVVYEFRDSNYPGGAPIAVDLTNDGIDELFFASIRFPSAHGARLYLLHLPTRRLIARDLLTNLFGTPLVADVRRNGALELIAVSWIADTRGGPPNPPKMTWQLQRLDLSARAPSHRTWAGYMGTTSDGVYRPTAPEERN